MDNLQNSPYMCAYTHDDEATSGSSTLTARLHVKQIDSIHFISSQSFIYWRFRFFDFV